MIRSWGIVRFSPAVSGSPEAVSGRVVDHFVWCSKVISHPWEPLVLVQYGHQSSPGWGS